MTEDKPIVVCLCGSTRFLETFRKANIEETLAGKIVLSIGCDLRTDKEIFADKTEEELERIKSKLDELHKRKIDLADEVLILNVDGYIGNSTRCELNYAISKGKIIRFLEFDAELEIHRPESVQHLDNNGREIKAEEIGEGIWLEY